MRRGIRRSFVPLAVLVGVALAACSADGNVTVPSAVPSADLADHVQGLPDGVSFESVPTNTPGGVGWSSDGTVLYVVTYGSGSCPWVPTGLEGDAVSAYVPLEQVGGPACTDDLGPTTSTVTVPAGVDTSVPVTLQLGVLGMVDVPPAADPQAFAWVPAPPYIASTVVDDQAVLDGVEWNIESPGGAGWSPDGTLLYVVTYGSSSCPIVPTDWVAGAEGLELGLYDYADAGMPCTADYGPTLSSIPVPEGVDTTVPQTLRLGDLGELTLAPRTEPITFTWLPAPE